MRPKTTYTGASITEQYLTVYFTSDTGGAMRFCEVKIPVRALESEVFHDAMEIAARGVRLRRELALDRQQLGLF